ncbi:hypothetical protein ACS0TY_036363 [Phlomoides rotata]
MSERVGAGQGKLSSLLVSRFFKIAKEAGMMSRGYAWIMVDVLTNLLHLVDSEAIEAMQGVIGVKAYVPRSNELKNFEKRWSKRFLREYPDEDMLDFNVYGLWAYDIVTALAEAIERVGVPSLRFKKPVDRGNLTYLDVIGTSSIGESLVPLIRNYTSRGLSGNFNLSNERYGISKKLKPDDDDEGVYSTKKDNLGPIIWPGVTIEVPKGWEFTNGGKKLRVGVPLKGGVKELINVDRHPETGDVKATGFSIDVFEQVMRYMPYAVPFEYIPFDEMVRDVTVTANRSEFADFTIPFTESGVVTIVPIRDNNRKNTRIFMKPLTTSLWLIIIAFFIIIGFVIWVLEHRVNEEFRGPPLQQVGMMFSFSFSTLVFTQREKVSSNLTRFVMIVWLFVVLVLTQSYTANLTSMLTVQLLRPAITEISDLIKSGEYVGYQQGSFVSGFLNNMKFDPSKFRSYHPEEYDEALSKGRVVAIVDEIPYIRLFLSKNSNKAILKLKEDEKMVKISKKWLGEEKMYYRDIAGTTSESQSVDSFKGLFVIAGEKIYGLARVFSREKDDESSLSSKESRTGDAEGEKVVEVSPAISISCDDQEIAMNTFDSSTVKADVGVFLDLDRACISMAIEDFYSIHQIYLNNS